MNPSLVLQSHDELPLGELCPVALRVGAALPLSVGRRPLAAGRRLLLRLLQLPLRLAQLHLQLLVLTDEVVVLQRGGGRGSSVKSGRF